MSFTPGFTVMSLDLLRLKEFRGSLFCAIGIGLVADGFSLGAEAIFGFFLIAPLTVLVLVMLFQVWKIRNAILIVLMTTLFFFLAMLFGFFQWIELRGNGTHMSGLLYYVGAVPSVILGLAYGFYLARKMRKQV